MVLEATMICIDNSEWMRNGDYLPTRLQAQADAVNLLCGQKTQSNPESTVGVMTLAGKTPRVLVTPTSDLGKVLSCTHGINLEGTINLTAGVQIAQLALKHRQNKNQRQRLVVFIASPISADEKELVKIGKKLKKNNVAIDIVSFGEENGSVEKLNALLNAVNSNDNSHYLDIPVGAVVSDAIISSPVFTGGEDGGGSGFAAAAAAGAAAAAAQGGGGGYEFGVDPNLDPELALALRVSMEEERARQERLAREAEAKGAAGGGDAPMAEAGASTPAPTVAGVHTPGPAAPMGDAMALDDDALLQQALAMSMQEAGLSATPSAPSKADAPSDMDTEDAELALALQMSMNDSGAASASGAGMAEVLGDSGFVNSVLSSLPGVDPNDPALKDMLAGLGAPPKEGDKDKDSK